MLFLLNFAEKFCDMKNKVLGIGSALVDILTKVDDDKLINEFGLQRGFMTSVDGEKSKMIYGRIEGLEKKMASGGSAANTIHGLGKLGVDAGFISVVGNDELGVFFAKDMEGANVTTYLSKSDSLPTGTATTFITNDGERTFATCLGASTELGEKHMLSSIFSQYHYLYLEGYLVYNRPLMIKVVEEAKRNNLEIILDTASANVVADNRDFLLKLIENDVDIVFANESEAKALTGLSPEDALHYLSKRCKIAIVKTGKEGSYVESGNECHMVKTDKRNCVDTTGAGDMYAAGFVAGLIGGNSLEKCAKMGTIVAGNVIEVLGSKMDSERWDRIFGEIERI